MPGGLIEEPRLEGILVAAVVAPEISLSRSRPVLWLACILLLAGVLRLGCVLLIPNAQYSDSVWYDAAAANLASSGSYGFDVPSAWFPPGYPFFLAVIYKVVGHSELAGKLGNVAIGVALTGCTYLLGRVVAGALVGLSGASVIAVWPNLVFATGILDSDVLAACGFAAAMWLGLRSPNAAPVSVQRALLGGLIGWMVLVRPVSVILLAALALWWWIRSGSVIGAIRPLAPLVVVAGLIVGAWTVRNYLQFGQVIAIATNGGYNFWQTNHRYADGNDTYWPFVPMDDPEYQTMRNGDEFTKNREGYRYALAYLRVNPAHLVALLPTKLFWLYHTDTSGLYEDALYPPMERPSPLASWIAEHADFAESLTFRYYELVMALALIGVALVFMRGRPDWLWPMLSLPVFLTLFHVFFHAKDRFHIPLDSVVAVFAGVTLVETARLLLRVGLPARSRESTV